MELKSQVTSLEISKRLKELGVKQESLYYHIYWDWNLYGLLSKEHMDSKSEGGKIEFGMDKYSAFTVAELGELLPDFYYSYWCYTAYVGYSHNLKPKSTKKIYECCVNGEEAPPYTKADTEADARGKMLIYLLENNQLSNVISLLTDQSNK